MFSSQIRGSTIERRTTPLANLAGIMSFWAVDFRRKLFDAGRSYLDTYLGRPLGRHGYMPDFRMLDFQ